MATAENTKESDWLEERTKPPFLRRVRIQGYKSIAFCEVKLQPLTILVGRNGAGKSNFLDALAFLRDATHLSIGESIRRHGTVNSIFCHTRGTQSLTIEVEVGLSKDTSERDLIAEYRLTVWGKE